MSKSSLQVEEEFDPKLLLNALVAFKEGDFSVRLPPNWIGVNGKIADAFNEAVSQAERTTQEIHRISSKIGEEGKTSQRITQSYLPGSWATQVNLINGLINDLVWPLTEITRVVSAVAKGDLSQVVSLEVEGRPLKGEFLRAAKIVNDMVVQLNSFASEVTRVAKEVGTDGKLGGQAVIKGLSGTWKDLTDNVNLMASNLTGQLRNISQVTTAVANGDLTRKITVDVKGEILELKNTINIMVDQLSSFASEVTRVAREVGTEGKLGGQAVVPGAAGIWKDLTDNVNKLAANLTTQVRAIAEVATAVTKGDLSRSITVGASGELAELKDNINEMIRNLRETTQRNTEQDWLKTNLTKFTRMLQGQRDLLTVSKMVLSELAPLVNAQHGVFYITEMMDADSAPCLRLFSSYAYKERKNVSNIFKLGEGLIGQAALEKQRILLTKVPEDYIQISSGLGEGTPLNIVVLPILFEGQVLAVIELASFNRFSDTHLSFLEQLGESIGIVLNTIQANMRTEELLKQSQSMSEELQSQQEELQQSNEELEEKAKLLSEQNAEVVRKNLDVEQAKRALEEKAEQLALASKYKSEFLSNMSHELRTPLNSLLILSKQLSDNPDGNLTTQQQDYAKTIHSSGNELLTLINDILDLAKIESGTANVEAVDVHFGEIKTAIERTFQPIATDKKLEFEIELGEGLPTSIFTDEKRLMQILKNLLSNAFKFTERGRVQLSFSIVAGGWPFDHAVLSHAERVIAFAVQDTGIGVSPDKQKTIFEAFQQADGTTSRKYGGTGLGLSISRELANLLGGEIRMVSELGKGSTFTLYLPQAYIGSVTPGGVSLSYPSAPVRSIPASLAKTASGRLSKQPLEGEIVEVPVQDDRGQIGPDDHVLLIIEDDVNFATILLDMAHEKNFKGLVALHGEEGISLAQQYKPDAITLDIMLPDIDGWTVLDRIKLDSTTCHIPVHIISVEEARDIGLRRGAFAFLEKPVSKQALDEAFVRLQGFLERKERKLLIVGGDEAERSRITELIGSDDIHITAVGDAEAALTELGKEPFDCMVLDLALPGMSDLELLDEMQTDARLRNLPVITYTSKELVGKEAEALKKLARTLIVKEAHSQEHLLAETALFLHRVMADLPAEKRKILEGLYQADSFLEGKKVLIVDDDVRNIFALTAALESHKMSVLVAESGKAAIEILQKAETIDVVLMDIMMPEMDGYETMRAIRNISRFKNLPIIALTAKAMRGDREKCIEAGASDYIAKPVNTDQLLSLLRVWLYQQ